MTLIIVSEESFCKRTLCRCFYQNRYSSFSGLKLVENKIFEGFKGFRAEMLHNIKNKISNKITTTLRKLTLNHFLRKQTLSC